MAQAQDIRSIQSWMYRAPGEHLALVISLFLVLVVGYFFSLIDIWVLLIIVVVGVVYVRLDQAQYLGNAVRVHRKQFPELYGRFAKFAGKLGISKAALYIKQDPTLQAYTLGLTTCTVVVNSALMEQLTEQELDFVIGHELGHFAAGHTKISTLVLPVGSNNIVGNLLFGIWNRKCEYSSDRCGLAVTEDVDSAVSALMKLAIGKKLYEKMDVEGYLSQIRASDTTSVKLSELLISHPLTTNRIRFLLRYWEENFAINEA